MGMGTIHVSTPARRDRLLQLNAFAVALLTLLGAAGEALGYDRMLKSNTTKRRTHSLFRQGCMLYELIPTMPEARLRPLIECFAALLAHVSASSGYDDFGILLDKHFCCPFADAAGASGDDGTLAFKCSYFLSPSVARQCAARAGQPGSGRIMEPDARAQRPHRSPAIDLGTVGTSARMS